MNISVRITCIKYLRVSIDENLKWNTHINNVASVISRNIGIMGRTKHYLTPAQMIVLYNALVLPHLNYCAVICERNYETATKKLVKLQKRAIRIFAKKNVLISL